MRIWRLIAAVAAIPGGVRRLSCSLLPLATTSRSRRDSGGREAGVACRSALSAKGRSRRDSGGREAVRPCKKSVSEIDAAVAAIPGGVRRSEHNFGWGASLRGRSRRDSGGREAVESVNMTEVD